MIDIHKIAENQYQLRKGGEALIKDVFFKIERLNENSNYYKLFPNDSCFLLYNAQTEVFSLNQKSAKEAHTFKSTDAYSFETNSFAAYRSDAPYVHLIYEDGSFERDTYIFIGPESKDIHRSRPIQLTGFAKENMSKWIYFHTKERKYAWNKTAAYEYYEGTILADRFNNGYYSTCKNGLYTLHFYKPADIIGGRRQKTVHFSERFDSITESFGYLICKPHDKSIYRIYKEDYNVKPLASFSSVPIRIDGKRMFVCKELEGNLSFLNLVNDKILENYSWLVGSEYEIEDNYLFIKKPDSETWRIYSRENGKEIFTGWKKITLKREDTKLRIFVDTDNILGLEIPISKIEEYHLQYLSKLSVLSQEIFSKQTGNIEASQPSVSVSIASDPDQQSISQTGVKPVTLVLPNVVGLPDKIDFITSISQISCSSNNTLLCSRKTNTLHKDDIIFWYDITKQIAYVTIFLINKAHRILWSKQLDKNEAELVNGIPGKKFIEAKLLNVTEHNIFEKVASLCRQSVTVQKVISDINEQKRQKELDIRYKKLVNFMMQEEYPKEKMEEVVKILLPDWKKPEPPVNSEKVVFTFNDESFSIAPDETWIIKDPFYRQAFLRKTNLVAVLLDKRFNEYSDIEGVDYEMIGQGQEKKFDQHFSPENANTAIIDKNRRILLFKRINNANVFFDEVECVGYHTVLENGVGSRQLIIFHLKSKCRKLLKRKLV